MFSAPAKVILFGEHWVVHGGLAVAAAIGLRAYAEAERLASEEVIICSREFNVCEDLSKGCRRFCWLKRGVERLEEMCGEKLRGLRINIRSDVPPGAGLGSSAAVATAVIGAISYLFDCYESNVVWDAAFEAEKAVHGNPSGIDNTVSLYGGFIVYRKGSGFQRLRNMLTNSRIVIVDSGISRSTAKAVDIFSKRLRRLGEIGKLLFGVQERLVEEAIASMNRNEIERVGELMDVAHGILNAMGVSHPEIEKLIFELRRLGAYGAKLTGAGLGGSVIALFDRERAYDAANFLKDKGYHTWVAEVGVEGLRKEE
jgi:mevalonate kinase